MPSREACEVLEKQGYPVGNCPYNQLDGLETDDDLMALLEALEQFEEKTGKKAILTLNALTANPDFKRIEESGFTKYFSEPIAEGYARSQKSAHVPELIRKGMESGYFQVQYHGREHLNITRWMRALNSGDRTVRDAFHVGVFGAKAPGYAMEFMDAFDYDDDEGRKQAIEQAQSGYLEFEKFWGYRSKSFIAPCYRWGTEIEKALAELGVEFIQGQRVQLHPMIKEGTKQKHIPHSMGQKNAFGQYYLVRNAHFEPSIQTERNWVESTFREIQIAFRYRNPAIISSHRINYTGAINPSNRIKGLAMLIDLLEKVVRAYPQVRFLSSDQLGNRIKQK